MLGWVGFVMFQYSVYIRHCGSYENLKTHIKRVKTFIPNAGRVSILGVTDKQYSEIVNFWGKKEKDKKIFSGPVQLEIIW